MTARGLAFQLDPSPEPAALEAAWRGLEARSDHACFLGWDWVSSWVAGLRAGAWLLSARAGGTVVLLGLVVVARERRFGVVPLRKALLHETGDRDEDAITIEYNGFLVDRAWQGQAEAAAVRFLLDDPRLGVDELHIRGADAALARPLEARLPLRVEASAPSWRVDLRAVREAPGDYLAQLSANSRQQIRRSMRLYEKRGRLDMTVARDIGEALKFLAALKVLHQRYWESRGRAGAFAHPAFEAFHRRLIARAFPAGGVELVRIGCGASPIGYLYNFVHRGTVSSYQSGFDYEGDAKLKPGLVAHALCIQGHADAGHATYDFLAGHSQYKASLGVPGPEMLHLCVQNPTWAVRAANGVKRIGTAMLRRKDEALARRSPARSPPPGCLPG